MPCDLLPAPIATMNFPHRRTIHSTNLLNDFCIMSTVTASQCPFFARASAFYAYQRCRRRQHCSSCGFDSQTSRDSDRGPWRNLCGLMDNALCALVRAGLLQDGHTQRSRFSFSGTIRTCREDNLSTDVCCGMSERVALDLRARK